MSFCTFLCIFVLTFAIILVLRDVVRTERGDAQAGEILKSSSEMDFQARFMFLNTGLEIE